MTVTVSAVAAQGDGLAATVDGRRLYIPFAAPGDQVVAAVGAPRGDGFEARIKRHLAKGPSADPFCPHFSTCGGCATQHLDASTYADWKRGILVRALSQRGLTPTVADLAAVPRSARRRVTFSAEKRGGRLVLGFVERRGHGLVDIDACPLLVDGLNALIAPLRGLLEDFPKDGEKVRLAATWLAGPALELVIERARVPDLADREALAVFAATAGLARLAWTDGAGAPEPVAQRAAMRADFGAPVDLPPGSFLQPTVEGEGILRRLVLEGAAGAQRLAELYCGAGTFTLALAGRTRVHAVDGDAAAVAALATAAGRADLGGRITTETRDLAARPLLATELKAYDTVVLDPPRAGALSQVEQVAAAPGIARAVMVSCNPATFARDARVLVDGGFGLETVTPVDQFPYSHHLECVGLFRRE